MVVLENEDGVIVGHSCVPSWFDPNRQHLPSLQTTGANVLGSCYLLQDCNFF